MALRPNVQGSGSGGNAFADLVARSEPGLGLLALALATAAVLGGFHALEPGHGKTVVARVPRRLAGHRVARPESSASW
jgi:hypothetical protein